MPPDTSIESQCNVQLKDLFNPGKMVDAMTKVVSAMTMKECPKTSQGTQYKGASNYIGRQWQPQLACGADGMLEPNTTYYYCKDAGHMKDNCVWLNNKIACELQIQQQVTATKATSKKINGTHGPKK